MDEPRIVVIAAHESTFTASCEACGTTFAGRLDVDLGEGVFLCRAGHPVHVCRAEPPEQAASAAA